MNKELRMDKQSAEKKVILLRLYGPTHNEERWFEFPIPDNNHAIFHGAPKKAGRKDFAQSPK